MTRGKYRQKKERAKKKAEDAKRNILSVAPPTSQSKVSGDEQFHRDNPPTKIGGHLQTSGDVPVGLWSKTIRVLTSRRTTDIWLALFTAVLAVVAVLQWFVTNRQLDVMRKGERAWLSVTEVGSPTLVGGQPLAIHLVIRNIGKTPAIDITALANPEFVVNGSEPNFVGDPPRDGTARIANGSLVPDETLDWTFARAGVDQITHRTFISTVTPEEIDSWNAGNSWIAVSGTVTFRDSFGIQHWVHFCKTIVQIETPNPKGYSSRSCTAYNKTDSD